MTVSKATETKTYEINFGEDGVYASSYAKDTVISLYSVGADADIDSEKSKITVSYSGPTSSVTSYTLKEFTDPGTRTIEYDANGNIKYKLSGNGTYTIKFSSKILLLYIYRCGPDNLQKLFHKTALLT